MSFMFGSKKPKVQEVQMPPVPPENKDLLEEEKKKFRSLRRRQTILTGPEGLLEPAEIKRKTLLGD